MHGENNPQPLITKVSHQAMATEFVVMLPTQWADQVECVVEALETLDSIERRLTIYRPVGEIAVGEIAVGEIALANQRAGFEPAPLSSATFDLLKKAIQWSERTGGAFDVTAGPLVEAWGFTQRSGKKPTEAEIEAAIELVGYQHLNLSDDDQSLRFDRQGMSINLGAIGKGDALDRLAADLREHGIADFLIHGGNSSVIAAGNQDRDHEFGWAVGVAHPTKSGRRLGGIWLKDTALATSGSGKQFFHHRGKRYGHVIDPRTGYPAGDLLSLTVVMESAADADACATGLFVMGSDQMDTLSGQDWFPPAVAVKQAGRQDEVEFECLGELNWVES